MMNSMTCSSSFAPPVSPALPAWSLAAVLAVLAAAAGSPRVVAAQEARPLSVGQPVAATLATDDTARYRLDTGPDHLVRLRVDQESVDVAVRVLQPDGDQIRRIDTRRRGLEHVQFETEERDGAFTVELVRTGDEDDPAEGAYVIVVEVLEPLESDAEELADQLLSLYDGPDSPGAAVRVWRDGRTLFTGTYGMANLAYGIPFEEDTPTNIGSTSKQFTAFAIQLLAERGELSLDDPVRAHIPELPAFDDTVRVRHLLTHTTGYREIFNLLLMSGRRIGEGDYVSRDEILAVVQAQPRLQNVPGSEWNYNNTAYALAAMVVERVGGQPFPEFMEENVFGPLGMDGTAVRSHAEAVIPGRSMGYAPARDGGYREIRDLGAAVGAGGIYATVEDLQTWVENYRRPRVGTAELIEEMMTSFVTTEGDTTGYGLGLGIDEHRGLRRIAHGGADIAHRSQLIYYPEIGAGITTQSNHADFDSGVAMRLAEAFFGEFMEPEEGEAVAEGAPFDADSYDPEDFDALTGRYALDANPAFVITLERDGDRMTAQATGQQAFPLRPTSDTTFALEGVEASFTVVRGEDDDAPEAIILHQGGANQRAGRMEAEAWTPDAEDLSAFVGRYLSDEIETFYTVTLDEGDGGDDGPTLTLKQMRLADIPMRPGDADTFTTPMGFRLSFERDRNGRVIAFYMSNGRTRDVRFQKVGPGPSW